MNIITEQAYLPETFLNNFLAENHEDCIESIKYGKDMVFTFINYQKLDLTKSSIPVQHIFNFNLSLVTRQLAEYFPSINIKIGYGIPCRNETLTKDFDKTIKNDVYICFNKDTKYFDCGFDFVKKTFVIGYYKNICSKVGLDYYKYFDEDYDNVQDFISKIISKLLVILCSIEKNKFKLSEILFIESNINIPNLQEQLERFRKIIYGKQLGKIEFEDFYLQVIPINPETGDDFTQKEFIKFIEQTIYDGEKLKLIENKYLAWDDFEWIIMKLNSDVSVRADKFKMVYIEANNALNLASDKIIELIEQINDTKKNIPQYLECFLLNDIVNYSNKEVLENVFEQLTNHFIDK